MLDGAGRVAHHGLRPGGRRRASTDVRAGTPAYMAPEQLAGRKSRRQERHLRARPRALRAVHRAARVRREDAGRADRAARVGHRSRRRSSVVKIARSAIERAILRCLDRDPARRPASALAVCRVRCPAAIRWRRRSRPARRRRRKWSRPPAARAPPSVRPPVCSGSSRLRLCSWPSPRLRIARSLLTRVPLTKPAAVLVDRAEEIRHALGYTDPPVDVASGFSYADDYLSWAAATGATRPTGRSWPRAVPRPCRSGTARAPIRCCRSTR